MKPQFAALCAAVLLAVPLAAAADSRVERESVTSQVTVQSVDTAGRKVVVKRPGGEVLTLDVPSEIKNLDKIRPGDTITTQVERKTLISVTPAGQATQEDVVEAALVSGSGDQPAGSFAAKVVVTGVVQSIDQANHILKLVSPEGGEPVNVPVTSEEGRKMMQRLKVGDRVTAEITETVVMSATR